MDEGVSKLYNEARANKEFNDEIKQSDPGGYIPVEDLWFKSDLTKHMYCASYYGWLVAKNRYKRSNYYKN